MKQIELQPGALLSLAIFSGLFGGAVWFGIQYLPTLILQIVALGMALILYLNIVKLFLYELFSIRETRMTEFLNYSLMYVVTLFVFLAPVFTEPILVEDFSYIRYFMIAFASIMFTKYVFFMTLGPIADVVHSVRHRHSYSDKAYNPRVSVIIPAWNEEVGILTTVESLLQSTYRRFEIVIINDGSKDNSDTIIRKFIRSYERKKGSDIPIQYRYQENTGKGGALNHGIELSRGEIIMSIDADCVVEPDAIGAFVESFKDPKLMAAVGNVKIGNKNHSLGIVQYLEFLFSFYFKRAEALMGTVYIIGGAAGAFRREVFEKIGVYSTTNITEDIDLSVRIQDAGMKIGYVPNAVVHTEGAQDFEGLKKQRLRWKRGRFQTFFQHRHLFFSTKKQHNKILSWGLLPLALIQEVQLLFELPFIIVLYAYTVLNGEFTSLMVAVVVVGLMFLVQFAFYDRSTRNWGFVLLAPIGWIIFYIATYVELTALLKTIWLTIRGKETVWQNWERKGVGTSGSYPSSRTLGTS